MLPVRTSGPVVGASADAAVDPSTGGLEVAIVSSGNAAQESGGNLAAAKADLDELLSASNAPSSFGVGQCQVQTTAAQLTSLSGGPGTGLKAGGFLIKNLDAADTVYVGTSGGASAGTGWPVGPGETSPNLGQDPTAIWLVASAGTPTIAWMWASHA